MSHHLLLAQNIKSKTGLPCCLTGYNRTMMLVSIIIPIYNVSAYLKDCLDSCVNQTYKNIEFICVDDGATDDSGQIADSYANADSRFKVIHKPNGGLPSARKAGLEIAKGDYIFHLDGDDSIPVNAISDLIEVAMATDADIVIGDYITNGPDNTEILGDSRIYSKLSGKEYLNFILKEGLFNIWGKLIKRTLYTRNSIQIPHQISMGEDLVQMTQLAYYSKICVPCKKVVYRYYIRPTSMSRNQQNIIGELTDRSIFAVEFVTRFLKPYADSNTENLLSEYNKQFVYTYLRSPYPTSLRHDQLKTLISFINESSCKIRSFRDLVCRIALYNMPLAKYLAKLTLIIR